MNTCKTCTHWIRFTDAYSIKYLGKHMGDCNNNKFIYGESKIPIDGFAYWDQESVQADFATGENFGCIHWKPKQ